MADSPASIDLFHSAIEYGLKKLGRAGLSLKEGQYEALKSVVVNQKDTICVLPTGYGKSLIYQLLPHVCDFYNNEENLCIIVVSPLNALIDDQMAKLKGNITVLKGANFTATELDEPPQILFAHPEALLENQHIFSVLRSKAYKERVKAIVVDEAHLVVEW